MYLQANDAKNSNFEIKKQSNSSLEKRIGTFFEKLEKEQTSEAFAHLLDNSTIGRKKKGLTKSDLASNKAGKKRILRRNKNQKS